MHGKSLVIAMTIGIYLMGLVGFQQHQQIADMRYDRLSKLDSNGWTLGSLISNVKSTSKKSEIGIPVMPMRAQPVAIDCDPILCGTIRDFNDDISKEGCQKLAALIEGTANMYGVDPYLVAALVSQESAFYESAVSPVGALGLGQLMPETARDLGVNPRVPRENLDGCVRYLAQNLDLWSNTKDPIAFALASYNAGPGAVEQFGGVPPYEETQHYVAVIKHRYTALRQRAVSARNDRRVVG